MLSLPSIFTATMQKLNVLLSLCPALELEDLMNQLETGTYGTAVTMMSVQSGGQHTG